jgi:hypothetical protein
MAEDDRIGLRFENASMSLEELTDFVSFTSRLHSFDADPLTDAARAEYVGLRPGIEDALQDLRRAVSIGYGRNWNQASELIGDIFAARRLVFPYSAFGKALAEAKSRDASRHSDAERLP